MVIGEMSKAMGLISDVAIAGDATKVAAIRSELVLLQARTELFAPVATLRAAADTQIGYIAGMFPPELGNRVLTVFQVQHPYFGAHIPDTLTECLDLGKKLGKEYARKLQTDAEIAKKNAQVADLGVLLPESDETVTNEDADKILTALKTRRGKVAPAVPPIGKAVSVTDMEKELAKMLRDHGDHVLATAINKT